LLCAGDWVEEQLARPPPRWRSQRGLLSGTAAGWRRETALCVFLAKKGSR
jgi:hypothetical protein